MSTSESAVLRQYWKTLVSVLGGNFLYFVIVYPILPPVARHRPSQLDWGLLIDFWICLALYGLLAIPSRRR